MKEKIIAGLLSAGLLLSVGCGNKVSNTAATTSAPQVTIAQAETTATTTTLKLFNGTIDEVEDMVIGLWGDRFHVTVDRDAERVNLAPKSSGARAAFGDAARGDARGIEAVKGVLPGFVALSEVINRDFPTWVLTVTNDENVIVYSVSDGVETINTLTK